MYDNYRDTFIAKLYNVTLAPDLCDRLFSNITLMGLGHTCLFRKYFFKVYFGARETNAVTLPHHARRKHVFRGEIKEISKTNKLPYREKIALELLQQRLGHRSARSLFDDDNANVWEDIEHKIYSDLFCT